MVIREQPTVQFQMDNLKCSHMDQTAVDIFFNDLNGKFRKEKKTLAKTRKIINNNLCLTINYSEKHIVKFTMYDYLEDILEEVPSMVR